MDQSDMETQKDVNNISTIDAFLNKFRTGFNSSDLSVARVGTKLTMNVGNGSTGIAFDLYEAKAAEKKTEFQTILFRLATKCSVLKSELSTANKQLEEALQFKKQSSKGLEALMDLSPKKVSNQNKPKPSKIGM